MRLSQVLLCCLAVATMVLALETAFAVLLERAHGLVLLQQAGTFARLLIVYTVSFAIPGLAVWIPVRLLNRRRTGSYGAWLPLITGILSLPLLNAFLTLRPAIARLLLSPQVLLPAAAVIALLSTALARQGRRGNRHPHRLVTVLILLAIAGLAVADQFVAHRLASQLLSTPGMTNLLLGITAAALLAVPLILAVLRGSHRWLAGAAAFYGAAFAVVAFGPTPEWNVQPPGSACSAPSRRPSVLLIVIDTLRADAVATTEASRRLAPNITAFREAAIDFPFAYSAAPWTTPSFASLLTSTYPSHHHCGQRDPVHGFKHALSAAAPTLTEVLAEAGYWSGAILTNGYLSMRFGLDRGFAVYRNLLAVQDNHPLLHGLIASGLYPVGTPPYMIAEAQNEQILAAVDRARAGGQPFFLLAHYMDPHVPYRAPKRFAHGPADLTTLRDRYLAEVTYCDHYVGQLLKELGNRGLYDDLLIIITSDHGEELDEARIPTAHGGRAYDHGHTLFDELLHVPLMIKPPGGTAEGAVCTDHVSLVDVAPTILDLLEIESPAGFQGESLLSPAGAGIERDLFAEALLFGVEQKAIMRGFDKLILKPAEPKPENALLYDRDADPGEIEPHGLEGATASQVGMFGALVEFMHAGVETRDSTVVEMDPKLQRQLEALGYLK